MVRRVIWIIAIILIAGYFINNYLEDRSREEAKKAESRKIEVAIKASVADLIRRTNAIDNWEEELSKGEKFRMAPILTIELEKLWISDRPILFIGSIKDITTEDKENYIIEIERSLFNFKYIFETELILELKCSKHKVDAFLNAHPEILKESGLTNGVAIVAEIKKIETKAIPHKEDGTREIKIGKGNCLEILYTGSVLF